LKASRTQGLALLLGILCLSAIPGLFAETPGQAPSGAGQSPANQGPAHAATSEKIVRYVQERFNIPATVKLTVGPFRDSPLPDFYLTTLTLDDGKEKRSQNFYVSKDERYLIEGNIYTLGADPRREIVSAITLKDQPSQGPDNAPVTLVEYADLQCPMCARLQEILENDVVPKYGDKVRVVFKEFPLIAIHDWALTGALASQCAYQIAPQNYVAFRSLVYQNQTTVDADNARDMLLHYGAQVGIDSVKLAACVDAKTSLPRVEASLQEGQALGIASTPTSFINGKVLVGAPQPADFFKILDEALRAAK
jgi:protein-disulfide isomerase